MSSHNKMTQQTDSSITGPDTARERLAGAARKNRRHMTNEMYPPAEILKQRDKDDI